MPVSEDQQHIKAVANEDTLLRLRAQTGKHLLRTQNVSEQNQKHFCVPDTKFVSATNVARQTGPKHLCPQQCVRNNVSLFASTLSLRITSRISF